MENRKLVNAWTCWDLESDQRDNSNHYSLQQYSLGNPMDDKKHVVYYRLFNDTYGYDQYFMNTKALADVLFDKNLDPFNRKSVTK